MTSLEIQILHRISLKSSNHLRPALVHVKEQWLSSPSMPQERQLPGYSGETRNPFQQPSRFKCFPFLGRPGGIELKSRDAKALSPPLFRFNPFVLVSVFSSSAPPPELADQLSH